MPRHFATLLMLAALAGCDKPPAAPEPVRAVRSITVQSGAASVQHEYAAEIRARTESRLGFRVPGKMLSRPVNLGDSVRPGQVLARLDPSDLRLGQDAAQAAYGAAQSALALSEAEYKRYKELREQGFISSLELERREAALKSARAQAEQARAQVSVQSNQAAYAVLQADVAGVVTAVDAEPGAVLSAGASVLRLAQDGPRDAVFSVPEDRVGVMRALLNKPGAVMLRLWGEAGGSPTAATLRELSAAADPATRTFLAKADVGTAPVRLGQTASVLVGGVVAPGAIKLPLSAVFDHKGQASVWLLDPALMTVRAQAISVAGAEGNLVVVGGGLKPGQVVVSAGVHTLSPGQKVKHYQEPGAAAATPAAAPAAASAAASR